MIGNADKGNNIQQSNQKLFEKNGKKTAKTANNLNGSEQAAEKRKK